MFDSIHKENIKKARESINPIVDTKKLCVPKYSTEELQGQHKESFKNRKNGLLV